MTLARTRSLIVPAALGIVILTTTNAQAQITAVTNIQDMLTGLNSDFSLGWEFTVNSPITVTQLGAFDEGSNGFNASHPVGIFRVSDQALLTSATITGLDTLDAGFRYKGVNPINLTAGQNYRVSAVFTVAGGDNFAFDSSAFTTPSEITFVSEKFIGGTTLAYPTQDVAADGGRKGYFSANFKFDSGTGTAVTPELPGAALFLPALLPFALVLHKRWHSKKRE